LSVGASPGIQFAALLHTDFSQYDYVFFDSVPNDEVYQYTTQGYSEVEFSTGILYELFSTISAESRLVILGVCNKKYFKQESRIYSLRRSLAASCGAEFIDVRQLMLAYSVFFVRRSGVVDLYDTHPSHPLPQHMFFIGGLIGRCLLQLPVVGELSGKCYRDGYSVWRASSMIGAGLNVVERSNSLLKESFALLVNGESLDFNEPGMCVGFYLNFRGTNAVASLLDADLKEVFHINLFGGVDDRIMKVFVPVPNGRVISKILVREHFAGECYTPVMFKKKRDGQPATELQISHAVFLRPNQDKKFDMSSIESSASACSNRLMNMVSSMIDSAIKVEQEKTKKPGVFDYYGRYIYFDSRSNKCVSLGSERKLEPADELWPVIMKNEDGKVALYAEVGKDLFLLSAYSSRISISNSEVLPVGGGQEDIVGDSFIVGRKKSNRFALRCGESFLSSRPNGAVVCNRIEAKNWELFSFIP
jgi:hypothetical protein